MVADVSLGTALNQQSQTAAANNQLAEDFSQFLMLLTTQLQNQDPLSPMDTTEFTNQIVAFTGVEQQINTNQKLDSLVSLQLNNALSSALDYVGLDVSYVSSELNFDGERPVNINYALQDEASEAKVRILNEEGNLVFEADGTSGIGNNEFVWDGTTTSGIKAPPGTYEVRIDALGVNGEPTQSTVVVNGKVRGVETQNGLTFLLIGERAVALSTILNASLPPEVPVNTDTGTGEGTGETGDETGGETDTGGDA